MARSVYTPSDALAVAYVALDNVWYEDSGWMEELTASIQETFPSMQSCRAWHGREGCVVLSNKLCSVVIAEYCGLVSVSFVGNDESCGSLFSLAAAWAERSKARLQTAINCVGDVLSYRGTFSNGEAFFQPADGVQKGSMGLGFTTKGGWL